MLTDESPFYKLAMTKYYAMFSDIITTHAISSGFEENTINWIFQHIWMQGWNKNDIDEFKKTVIASNNFLLKGSYKKYEKIVKCLLLCFHNLSFALRRASSKRINLYSQHVAQNISAISIENFLSLYKCYYEGIVPVSYAPVVYAFSIYKNINKPLFLPDEFGKISLNAIEAMSKILVYPGNRLAIGLDAHVRNAYSHEKFRIMDDGHVEITDYNIKTKTKFGPKLYHVSTIEELCEKLWKNALAVIIGLITFGMNERKRITEMKININYPDTNMSNEEITETINYWAKYLCFNIKKIYINSSEISISLRLNYKGIDQISQLSMGSKDKLVEAYDIEVKYVEIRIIEQATGLIQYIMPFVDKFKSIHLNIYDEEDRLLGSLKISTENARKFKGPKNQPIDDVLTLYEENTVGDNTMWIMTEGPPIRKY